MNPIWPITLLDHLELVDTQEAPHGLYGMCRAYAPEGRLPTAAHVLSAPGKVGLLKKCGFSGSTTGQRSDVLEFTAEGESVSLQILDYATTKVRHYGSVFRIDKRHVKQQRDPAWDLETLVPKLERDRYWTYGILLIAHYSSIREIEGVLGKTTDPAFLDRYKLALHHREWEDRYARGFCTALHLWVPRDDDAEPDPASGDGPAAPEP
jgi:hypothetical protein